MKVLGFQLTRYSFEELARSTEDMNGAQLKAVCVEAGMVSYFSSWSLRYTS